MNNRCIVSETIGPLLWNNRIVVDGTMGILETVYRVKVNILEFELITYANTRALKVGSSLLTRSGPAFFCNPLKWGPGLFVFGL